MSSVAPIIVVEQATPPRDVNETNVNAIIDEKNHLITCQHAENERLTRELTERTAERDALLCELSKLKFELEIADIKRLHDDR